MLCDEQYYLTGMMTTLRNNGNTGEKETYSASRLSHPLACTNIQVKNGFLKCNS
jgi:hypothetical protein